MTPNEKCPHGVYLAGEEKARYCQTCTPGIHDRTLHGLPKFKIRKSDSTIDSALRVDTFMSLPFGARVARLEAADYD